MSVVVIMISMKVYVIMEEVNKPLSPEIDRFFLTWRTTDNPPLIYEDVDSDDVDSIAGLNENKWTYQEFSMDLLE